MTPTGQITNSARTLLHELLHAVVFELDLDLTEEQGEAIAYALEQVYQDLVHILSIVRKPMDWHAEYQLLNLIRNVRARLRSLYMTIPGDAIARILEELGLFDDEWDGLPDFLEDILRDLDIEEDELWDSPHPPPEEVPGGCGSVNTVNEFNMVSAGPTGDSVLVVDPSDQFFRVDVNLDGSFTVVRGIVDEIGYFIERQPEP